MLRQAYDYLAPNWGGMVNDRRHNLIRYSEILLWYAESAALGYGEAKTSVENNIEYKQAKDYNLAHLTADAFLPGFHD